MINYTFNSFFWFNAINVVVTFSENHVVMCSYFSASYLGNKVLFFIVQLECFLDGLLMIRE